MGIAEIYDARILRAPQRVTTLIENYKCGRTSKRKYLLSAFYLYLDSGRLHLLEELGIVSAIWYELFFANIRLP